MSEKKKVIYVKDLIIKADNVYVEPQEDDDRNDHKRNDPLFGGVEGTVMKRTTKENIMMTNQVSAEAFPGSNSF
ncbi:hypothetical protein MUO14_20985 [Halobacillus shinanisalinarum]|uniref:Uncharacterized protein n=1 Tax=Halobacillus shinanisalinarum TaxID=2932258 RepID=A0ABY4GYV8_9BACI|nr:hypothetical protein [Halobacillus shinanisalinarum]UOQ92855.1 hypothetical protein MUO14_20985 [Halobacillus shinanisalinarum]